MIVATQKKEDHERRLVARMAAMWQDLKQKKELPWEDHISPEILESMWDSCFMVRIEDIEKERGYSYSYLGADIKHAYGYDLSEDIPGPLACTIADRLHHEYTILVNSKKPLLNEGEFENHNGVLIKYRQGLFPFASEANPNHVVAILGGMRYKTILD